MTALVLIEAGDNAAPDAAASLGDNLSVASNFITRCSNVEIKVSIGGNGTCDVVVDVIGFYR